MHTDQHTGSETWRVAADDALNRRLEATHRLFQRTLSQWVVDLLRLRQQGIRWASWSQQDGCEVDRRAA
jgi:hypothetical protein